MSDPNAQLSALSAIAATGDLPRLAAGGRQQAPELQSVACFVRALPERMLSTNAGSRSRRDPWAVANAKMILKGETIAALMGAGELPKMQHVTADVTLLHSGKRPKAEDCPRCRPRIADGTYPGYALPEDRSKPIPCCCYRPTDVGNIGGEVLKPILDALTYLDILVDDSAEYLTAVTLRIQRVTNLDDEGIALRVTEIDDGGILTTSPHSAKGGG